MKPNSWQKTVRLTLLVVSALLGTACDSRPTPTVPQVGSVVPPGQPRLISAHLEGPPVYYRKQGDLWMNTWADDGHLYMGWGDGSGRGDCCPSFGQGPPSNSPTCGPVPTSEPLADIYEFRIGQICGPGQYCFCRFTDAGLLIFQEAPMQPSPCQADCVLSLHVPNGNAPVDEVGQIMDRSDKPSSLLFLDGTLYWAGHYPLGEPTYGYLAYSQDYGRNWTEISNSPWTAATPFRVMMFINMGQAYAENSDGFVYALAMGTETKWSLAEGHEDMTIYLTRVPRSKIRDYGAYTYYTGKNPPWSSQIGDAEALPGLRSRMQGSAMYHPGIGEYLFLTASPGALFAAPEPWGPWREVARLLRDDVPYPPGWRGGGYIPGLIAKGSGPDHVYFTISGDGGLDGYQLTMGKIRFVLGQP